MSHEVLIPPLTQTGDTVKLVTWYKLEGAAVVEGEPLYAIETDKAVLDVEAQASGILRNVKVLEGEDARTLSVAALIEPAIEKAGSGGESRRDGTASGASPQPPRQSSTRAIIAERMWKSASTTARVTLTTQADATELVALRRKLAGEGLAASYNDFFILILGQVLREQPTINASLDGDVVHQWEHVHISLAVDTPRGLLAPVLRDVQTRSLRDVADGTRELVEKIRAGKLPPDALHGGTFTLTNLGAYGVDAFTPIINLPEAAILGVGRIKARPVVRGDQVVARDTVWLSLTFDHRVVDGGPAGSFLQRVVELVGNPSEIHNL